MNSADLLRTLSLVLGGQTWPKPLHLLQGYALLGSGRTVDEVASQVGTTRAKLRAVIESGDPVTFVLELESTTPPQEETNRASQMLGQLLLGRCAEIAFEELYKTEVGTSEFELRDLREGGTDTDYRLYNGQGRPVYRTNIKFHGSPFRRAPDLVKLESEDCFALATYKINSALEKQQQEGLPYFFAIVGVPNLTGAVVGEDIPRTLVEAIATLRTTRKRPPLRLLEDSVISYLVDTGADVFVDTLSQIFSADWYVLSAQRAHDLMRQYLFERVFALRIRNFARVFGRAELDMHFSLSRDLIPLREFLTTLRRDGPQRITSLFAQGTY